MSSSGRDTKQWLPLNWKNAGKLLKPYHLSAVCSNKTNSLSESVSLPEWAKNWSQKKIYKAYFSKKLEINTKFIYFFVLFKKKKNWIFDHDDTSLA